MDSTCATCGNCRGHAITPLSLRLDGHHEDTIARHDVPPAAIVEILQIHVPIGRRSMLSVGGRNAMPVLMLSAGEVTRLLDPDALLDALANEFQALSVGD